MYRAMIIETVGCRVVVGSRISGSIYSVRFIVN